MLNTWYQPNLSFVDLFFYLDVCFISFHYITNDFSYFYPFPLFFHYHGDDTDPAGDMEVRIGRLLLISSFTNIFSFFLDFFEYIWINNVLLLCDVCFWWDFMLFSYNDYFLPCFWWGVFPKMLPCWGLALICILDRISSESVIIMGSCVPGKEPEDRLSWGKKELIFTEISKRLKPQLMAWLTSEATRYYHRNSNDLMGG